LKVLYQQMNYALQYQLEMNIRATKQEEKSVHDFYAHMSILWDQTELMEPQDIQVIPSQIKYRETQRLTQF